MFYNQWEYIRIDKWDEKRHFFFSSLIWYIPLLFHLTLCLYSKQKLKVYLYICASIYIHHQMYIVIIIFYLNDICINANATTRVQLLSSRCVYLIDASLDLLRRFFFHYIQILFTRRRESNKKKWMFLNDITNYLNSLFIRLVCHHKIWILRFLKIQQCLLS